MNETESTVGKWKPARSVQLPEGWRWTTIGDVASDTQIGIVRSKAQQNREGQGVPYLKMNNLTMSVKVTTDDMVFVQATQDEINGYALRGGDILFNTRNSIELVGKTGIVTQGASGFIYNNNLMRIRTKPNVLPLFIAYQMCSPDFRNRMERVKRSTTNVAALYAKDVLPLPIALAPVDQQSLIVAEIEKQFSRLDEGIANLKRVKANLKRYRAAVLKAAVEGKLTEEWRKAHPDVEPGSELLKRILGERRDKWEQAELVKMKATSKQSKDDKWKKRYQEAHPVRPEEIYNIPKSWVWSNLGQLSWSVKDGPHYSPKYATAGIPFITGGNIRPEGIDFSSAKYISPQLHADLSERCKPEGGDLLYTKGGTTGIARINTEKREFNVWVHVAVLKLVDSIEPFYLQHSLNSPHCYRQSQQYTHGVGNQDLGLTRMIGITIPLPPLMEQKQIICEIESRLSVVNNIEKEIGENLSRAERFRHTLLRTAFSGTLLKDRKEPVRAIGEVSEELADTSY